MLSIAISTNVLTFLLCFYVLFIPAVPLLIYLGKTLVYDFHIYHSHAGWHLLHSLSENGDEIWKQSAVTRKFKPHYGMVGSVLSHVGS